MKLSVLIDNNTIIDNYLTGEPALAIYIEDNKCKILFDAGYSDAFIMNAKKMNIDLSSLDYVILSHGHIDHTWGLKHLISEYGKNFMNIKPILIAHPLAFNEKFVDDEIIGAGITEEELSKYFKIQFTQKPCLISQNLFFLGEIPRKNDYEAKIPIGKTKIDGKAEDDYLLDDSALVYKSNQGLVIITGCSHSGICNIIEYAKEVCQEEKIADIIGGFHLLKPSENVLQNTIQYLKSQNIKQIHPCHCTDLKSKISLSENFDFNEVGVGFELSYN